MKTRTLRPILTALLLAVAIATMGAACKPGAKPRIGDVNGDNRFDGGDLDALLAILTANDTDPSPLPGPDLADVALPCGGPADEADMRRLRAALALSEAIAEGLPDPGVTMESQCHPGGVIGFFVPPTPPSHPSPATLDEGFEQVAALVPGFGGAYEENGQLKVVLRDAGDLAAAVDALVDVFGPGLPQVPPEPVIGTFGFDELASLRTTSEELLFIPEVVSVDVDERKNALQFGVSDPAKLAEVTQTALSMGIPAEAFTVVVREPLAPYAFVDGLRETKRPIRGGLQIVSGGTCTMGPVVEWAGKLGFLTNSHCTSNLGQVNFDVFNQATGAAADMVGVEAMDSAYWGIDCPGNLCTFADAAFIEIDPGVTGVRGSIRHPNGNSTIVLESPTTLQGQYLRKSGRTTGYSEGEVSETCSTVKLTNNNVHFCQNRVEGASDGGDSGSPVYRELGTYNQVAFHGLLFAGPTGGGDYFWFSPLGLIEASLGGIDAVNANEPPQLTITSPTHTENLGSGSFFTLQLDATFFDFEWGDECPACEVAWTSSVDGPLGTSAPVAGQVSLTAQISGAGPRWIYATATDQVGNTTTESVLVVTSNSAPTVSIVAPTQNETIQAGPYVLEGTSFDSELFAPLPCSALQWTSAGIAGQSATGCTPIVYFPNVGTYSVLLTGQDGSSGQGQDVRTIQVVPGPNTGPPNVLIESPLVGGFGSSDVQMLRAWGDDPDDKSPITYQWVLLAPTEIVRPDAPPQDVLGTNGGITEVQIGLTSGLDQASSTTGAWLPGTHLVNFCGYQTAVEIEARAQDADGQPATATRQYVYTTPSC